MVHILLLACSNAEPEPIPAVVEEAPATVVRSADWIAALPEGDTRRQVVLGCTPCHQLGPPVAHKKTQEEWLAVIQRMKQIDDDLDLQLIPLEAEELAAWLAENSAMPEEGFAIEEAPAQVDEFVAGPAGGFYHDMTVAGGKAWIADYFGNTLHGIDLKSGEVSSFDIPVDVPEGKPGGAHQIDVTADGRLWLTFTKSNQVLRFDLETEEFRAYGGFEPGSSVQYFVVDADRFIHQDEEIGRAHV